MKKYEIWFQYRGCSEKIETFDSESEAKKCVEEENPHFYMEEDYCDACGKNTGDKSAKDENGKEYFFCTECDEKYSCLQCMIEDYCDKEVPDEMHHCCEAEYELDPLPNLCVRMLAKNQVEECEV